MDNTDRYVSLVLEEYKSLRDESKQATINMWTAMQWTSVIFAALFGVGLNQWSSEGPTALLVFGLLVPCFSLVTMLFWLGEAVRLKRTGDYIYLLERKLALIFREAERIPDALTRLWPKIQQNEEFRIRITDAPEEKTLVTLVAPLSWETWLRERRSQRGIHAHQGLLFAFRLGFFLMVSVGSSVLALLWLSEQQCPVHSAIYKLVYILGGIVLVATLGNAIYWGRSLNVKMRPLNTKPSTSPPDSTVLLDH
ncbi:MAG TPA: hypothetical protein VGC13_13275 [Longimicrobium sp.]|jgi:hypothetical protein|uniref:hypothetical protein n=1 Tax=Longimicrobium sp. TaxID=2029185 RepID=UPI002ED77DF6